jgi:hypothetical protein
LEKIDAVVRHERELAFDDTRSQVLVGTPTQTEMVDVCRLEPFRMGQGYEGLM